MGNIAENWITGDPAKIESNGKCVYGRFYEEDTNSAYYDGRHAVLLFITPGGTKIRLGRSYLQKLDNDDQKELSHYEEIQKEVEDFTGLYNNEMIVCGNAWIKNTSMSFVDDEVERIEDKPVFPNDNNKVKVLIITKYLGKCN